MYKEERGAANLPQMRGQKHIFALTATLDGGKFHNGIASS